MAVEWVNGKFFTLLYPRLPQYESAVLARHYGNGFSFSEITAGDIDELSAFAKKQPPAYLAYFDPHPFDVRTLKKMLDNRSFAMMKVTDDTNGRIVGYFFLRCFFTGKAFHGLVVDEDYRNRGLGSAMWALSSEICDMSGLKMCATVSERNAASLISANRGTAVTVVEKLTNDYLLIACKMKHKNG